MGLVSGVQAEDLLGNDLSEYGLAGLEHTPEVGPTEAASRATVRFSHDILKTPAALPGERKDLRERPAPADTHRNQNR